MPSLLRLILLFPPSLLPSLPPPNPFLASPPPPPTSPTQDRGGGNTKSINRIPSRISAQPVRTLSQHKTSPDFFGFSAIALNTLGWYFSLFCVRLGVQISQSFILLIIGVAIWSVSAFCWCVCIVLCLSERKSRWLNASFFFSQLRASIRLCN